MTVTMTVPNDSEQKLVFAERLPQFGVSIVQYEKAYAMDEITMKVIALIKALIGLIQLIWTNQVPVSEIWPCYCNDFLVFEASKRKTSEESVESAILCLHCVPSEKTLLLFLKTHLSSHNIMQTPLYLEIL